MTRTEVPNSYVTREQEIGLRLPNGTTVYPPDTWHGHPLTDAAEREAIVALIRAAAIRLGYDENHFVEHYAWATREKISAVVYEQGDELPFLDTGFITQFLADESIPRGEPYAFDPNEFIGGETLPNDALVD